MKNMPSPQLDVPFSRMCSLFRTKTRVSQIGKRVQCTNQKDLTNWSLTFLLLYVLMDYSLL